MTGSIIEDLGHINGKVFEKRTVFRVLTIQKLHSQGDKFKGYIVLI